MERIQEKQTINIVRVQSVKITFILNFYIPDPTDSSNDFFFLSCREKTHDNKEFIGENSKPRHELRIKTC